MKQQEERQQYLKQIPTTGFKGRSAASCKLMHIVTLRKVLLFMIGQSGTSKPLLSDLACLKVIQTNWYDLGLQLNINENELDKIKANNPTDVDSCILDMFKTWLKNTPDATYAELKDALDRIGEHSVAAQLLQPSGRHMKQRERVI